MFEVLLGNLMADGWARAIEPKPITSHHCKHCLSNNCEAWLLVKTVFVPSQKVEGEGFRVEKKAVVLHCCACGAEERYK